MSFPSTLSRYLARSYLINLMVILGVLLGLIYLFDTVELMRRASVYENIPLPLIMKMGLLKLPEVGQIIIPFAILFSAMYTFWCLTRNHELVIVRAAGLSAWQFLAPVIGVALSIGVLQITLINPIGALLIGKFDALEHKHLSNNRKDYVTFINEGLWLRQANESDHLILHADRIKLPAWELQKVMVLFFDREDNFYQRYDAHTAQLKNGQWVFKNVTLNRPHEPPQILPSATLPTLLTSQEIEDSFAPPETISFWQMRRFIKTMEVAGLDATRLRIHFFALLAQPLLLAAMILLAATVSLRPARSGGTLILIIGGIFIGFIFFFTSSFLQALGTSHQIPPLLAAWSPTLIAFLLGLTVIMNQEDG